MLSFGALFERLQWLCGKGLFEPCAGTALLPAKLSKPQVGDLEVAELSGPFGNSTQQDQLSSGEVVREGSTSDDLLP